jgi:hypothetical protein
MLTTFGIHAFLIGLVTYYPTVGVSSAFRKDAHFTLPRAKPDALVNVTVLRERGKQQPITLSKPELAPIRVTFDGPELSPVELSADDPVTDVPSAAPALAGAVRIQCEVQIHQSQAGEVQSIVFGKCGGDYLWQRALIEAIQRSAKLISTSPEANFPPVRTITFDTESISPTALARELSVPDLAYKSAESEKSASVK